LVDQINAIIGVFVPRMAAAGNPHAIQLGAPEVRRRSRLIGGGVVEKIAPRGPLGWRVASVGTGDGPDSSESVRLAAIGLDVNGRLLDLTHHSHEPPIWELGAESDVTGGPPREFDDYDYRYLAEREIPRSLHELLLTETGSGLTDDLLRCYYCGHAGFHELSAIGALWSLENWPRTCEDCIACWVG